MFFSKFHDQTIREISQGDLISQKADSFLIDRQARERSSHTIRFYREYLRTFLAYCEAKSLKFIQEINPEALRRYLLTFGETHNPGSVHGAYRTLRAFFQWLVKEELMPPIWKNPMRKVKVKNVELEPLQPIALEDVRALLTTCQRGDFIGERDRAVCLCLLDTGARAQELCGMNTQEIDLNTGAVQIRNGKSGKSRTVFIGRKTRRAMRSYLRLRQDGNPDSIKSRAAIMCEFRNGSPKVIGCKRSLLQSFGHLSPPHPA